MTVGDARDERVEPDPGGHPAQEGQHGVRLGHRRIGRQPADPDLEEVVPPVICVFSS
jgi:hypothetical protein